MLQGNEWKLGWKVCKKPFCTMGYFSFGPYDSIKYEIGKVSYPKKSNGPLAVFKTRKNAREFRNCIDCGSTETKIFRCKYLPSERKYLKIDNYFSCGLIFTKLETLPKGTVLAEAVMLLERKS